MVKWLFRTIVAGLLLFSPALVSPAALAQASNLEDTLYIDLKDGRVVIRMRPDLAPGHIARIKELARAGFYDNTPIHRVIDGFMAQMGDPTGTGTGNSGKADLKQEFSREPHVRGTVSMARRGDSVDSANSQFFICFAPAPFLDGQYTVWGRVTEGMDVVDKIKKGAGQSGTVRDPDKIVRVRVAIDVKDEKKS